MRFKLPEGIGKITHLGTCFRCVVVATADRKLYFKNRFMQEESENMSTGIQEAGMNRHFGNGELVSLGGCYRNRYALIRE